MEGEEREKGRRKTRGERLRVRSVKNASWVLVCCIRRERNAIFTGVQWMEERAGYSSDSTNKWHDDCDASYIYI